MQVIPDGYEYVGDGNCRDNQNMDYDFFYFVDDEHGAVIDEHGAVISSKGECIRLCEACACEVSDGSDKAYRGFAYLETHLASSVNSKWCRCYFDDADFTGTECKNLSAGNTLPESSYDIQTVKDGSGVISGSSGPTDYIFVIFHQCYKIENEIDTWECPSDDPPTVPVTVVSSLWLYYPRISHHIK